MSKDEDKKKIRLPGILLGVAIVLAIVVAILHAVPCIPIPAPAFRDKPSTSEPAKAPEEPKKPADPPVQPVEVKAVEMDISKPDLGIPAVSLK